MVFGFLPFGRSNRDNDRNLFEEIDLHQLVKLLNFEAKLIGNNGRYILQIKPQDVDRWLENILLVEGDTIYISHEPDTVAVKLLAEQLNIPLEYTFKAKSPWEFIGHLNRVYENLRKLYLALENTQFYKERDQLLNLIKELKVKRDPALCAKAFSLLEELRKQDYQEYLTFRKKLVKECDRIIASSLDDGGVQKSCNRRR